MAVPNRQWLVGITPDVLFKIWRGAPVTGQLVCSVQDSAESFFDSLVTTDFSEVVTGLVANQPVTFVLTAETVASNLDISQRLG